MSIPNNRRPTRRPTHPGEFLRDDFMPDFGLSVASLAKAIGVSRQSVNELLGERRALSADMALRLGRLFGQSAEYWLNCQRMVDLWDAEAALKDELAIITPLRQATIPIRPRTAGRALAALGGTMPALKPIPRRRSSAH